VGGRGSARTPLGELTALPQTNHLARLRALLLKGREDRDEKVEGRGRGEKGKGEVVPPLFWRKLRP